jgi:branched-chain amino acid transport system ATP-binding protein
MLAPEPSSDRLLEVRGIDVFYGHIQALRGISLEVAPGEVVALVGANGAGKTTTLRSISGLLRPVVGEVWFDGERIDRMPPEEVVARGVSHLPEGRGIFPSLTVGENLRMGFYTKRRERAAFRAALEEAIELFPRLGERINQAAGTLSGGEQQMLALARALLPGPRLLMIDELSLGLAPVVVQMLFTKLREINQRGTTVLLVEQYVNLALQVADRAYVLAKGEVTLAGSAAQLARDPDTLRASYLGGHGVAVQTEAADATPGMAEASPAVAVAAPKPRRPRTTTGKPATAKPKAARVRKPPRRSPESAGEAPAPEATE